MSSVSAVSSQVTLLSLTYHTTSKGFWFNAGLTLGTGCPSQIRVLCHIRIAQLYPAMLTQCWLNAAERRRLLGASIKHALR